MSNENAKKAAAMQRKHAAESKKQHEKDIAQFKDELKADTEKGLYDMSLTEKQTRGFGRITFTGVGSPKPWKKEPSPWRSKCCKAEVFNYRTVYLNNKKEEHFRCKECHRDCDVIPANSAS